MQHYTIYFIVVNALQVSDGFSARNLQSIDSDTDKYR